MVRVMVAPAEAAVKAGGELALEVLVHNVDTAAESYLVDVAGAPAAWIAVDAPYFSLEAGGLQRVTVTIRPPELAPPTEEPLRLIVRVTPNGNFMHPGLAAAQLAVRAADHVAMDIPVAGLAGPEGTFRPILINPTDARIAVALHVEDGGAGLRVHVEPQGVVSLPPHGQVALTVRVRPPRKAPTTPHTYHLALCAQAVRKHDGANASLAHQVRFIYIPRHTGAKQDARDVPFAAPRNHKRRPRRLLLAGAPLLLGAVTVAGAVHALGAPSYLRHTGLFATAHAVPTSAPPRSGSHRSRTTYAKRPLGAPGRIAIRPYTSRHGGAGKTPALPAGAHATRTPEGAGPSAPPILPASGAFDGIVAAPRTPTPATRGVTSAVLSPPTIEGFTLRHDRLEQPYRLAWGVRDAQRVTLDGRPVPAQGHDILRAPLHTHTYLLIAGNEVGQVTARVRIIVPAATTSPSRSYTIVPQAVQLSGARAAITLGPSQ